MFSSFTSILSPAIKEKLGLGPKPVISPAKPRTEPRPVTLPANRTLRPLPASLHTEVQSPGFSSRLTSYLREEEGLEDSRLQSPARARLGVAPVSLSRRPVPVLSPRTSTKYGRGDTSRVSIKVRMSPQQPYSPFTRGGAGACPGAQREEQSSTDPRQVIAVLAELSGEISNSVDFILPNVYRVH